MTKGFGYPHAGFVQVLDLVLSWSMHIKAEIKRNKKGEQKYVGI